MKKGTQKKSNKVVLDKKRDKEFELFLKLLDDTSVEQAIKQLQEFHKN